LIVVCFYGIIALVLYALCVKRHSCQRLNNQLLYFTACVMTSVNVNGSGKFKNKSLMSSRNPYQNALIRVLLSQSMSHAS
jgi:hypothetical protein